MLELAIAVGVAVGISAMCSVFEAVLYSVPISHIESLAQSGRRTGAILRSLRADVDRPIAAILTLNTVANTAGATVAGAAAARVFGSDVVGYFSAAFTLTILLFSEVIPKTAGVVYSRALAPLVARPLLFMVWVLRPMIWVTGLATRLVARGQTGQDHVSEDELLVMARLGLKAGSLDANEAGVIENILSLESKVVDDIMTPRTVIFSLRAGLTVGEVRDQTHLLDHSRMPVFGEDTEDIVGMVMRREVLTAMVEGRLEATLESMMRPVDFVAESVSLDRVLRTFLERRQHLLMVIDEFGGLSGLVTLEDVLEEVLGQEIVDEFDPATDMRELAHDRRRRTAAARESRRGSGSGAEEGAGQ